MPVCYDLPLCAVVLGARRSSLLRPSPVLTAPQPGNAPSQIKRVLSTHDRLTERLKMGMGTAEEDVVESPRRNSHGALMHHTASASSTKQTRSAVHQSPGQKHQRNWSCE